MAAPKAKPQDSTPQDDSKDAPQDGASALVTFSRYERKDTPRPEDAPIVVEITGTPRKGVDPYTGKDKS